MDKEFPLYPDLSPEAAEEAAQLLETFKGKMLKVCEETLSTLYTDISAYIESDQWSNFRNQVLDGLKNYNNRKIQGKYDFAAIRKAILDEHRADIIDDLDQDMLEEIQTLKMRIRHMEEMRRPF